jgi:tetratricopeptide (TPR) repeat protein
MIDVRTCERCGAALGDGPCSACQVEAESQFVQRELVVLIVLSVVVVIGFLLTRAVARANDRLRLDDAAVSFAAAERDLAAGRHDEAIAAFRRAATIDRTNRQYRLALVRALVTARQDNAARQVLVGIRQLSPEDSEVNLQLAQLEARQGDTAAAIRYYQNALYGAWRVNDESRRREARVEFVRYLLAHDERSRALSELLILSANLPDQVTSQLEAGTLFRRAGDSRRALDHFRHALRLDPDNGRALAGAGESAFDLGDYTAARGYLRAAASDPASPEYGRSTELLQVADLVLERDPLRPRLSLRDRWDRLATGVSRAHERLQTCIAGGTSLTEDDRRSLESLLAEIVAFEHAHAHPLRDRAIEPVEAGLNLVYRAEQRTAPCSPPSVLDRALLIVGHRYDDRQ